MTVDDNPIDASDASGTSDSVEARARRRVEARLGFYIHLTMYLFANGAMFAIWWTTGRGYPWFIWPLMGWGIGIVGHAVGLFIGPESRISQDAVARELKRLQRLRVE